MGPLVFEFAESEGVRNMCCEGNCIQYALFSGFF